MPRKWKKRQRFFMPKPKANRNDNEGADLAFYKADQDLRAVNKDERNFTGEEFEMIDAKKQKPNA